MYEVCEQLPPVLSRCHTVQTVPDSFCVCKKSYRSVNIALILQRVYIYYSKGDLQSDLFKQRFVYFTANGLRLTVSSCPSAHIWDLRFAGGSSWLPCLLSFITFSYLAEKLSSKLRFSK